MLKDADIKRAIRDVVTETVLNDGGNGRGSGSLQLVVRRLANGEASASWFATWKRNGKRGKKQLGRYPDMPARDARIAFAGFEIGSATPLAGDRPTVEKMFAAYIVDMRAKGRASADEVERVLLNAKLNAADTFGRNRLAGDITDRDVVHFISKHYNAGNRGAADKARAYISAAYGWAKKSANDYTVANRRDWGIKLNPVADVPKDSDASTLRERTLNADELQMLWNADGWSLEVAAVVKLIIATGQRVQECLRLHGSELDLKAAVWNMPAHKTKTQQRPHFIPLPACVVPILAELKAAHGDGALFPARTGSKSAYIGHRSVNRALKRQTVAPMQARDLRRTWKSRAGEIGISKEVRDLIQQHSHGDTGGKHYDRGDYLPMMRRAIDTWNDWLLANVAKPDERQLQAA